MPAARCCAFLLIAALSGAAQSLPADEDPNKGETISYKTQSAPFCGPCDTIALTVFWDGRVRVEHGYWAGHYQDWRVVRRTVRVPADRVAAFRARLAPYRPEGAQFLDDSPQCEEFLTDQHGVSIAWTGGGTSARLIYNYGCDPTSRAAMAKALSTASDLLGIKLDLSPAGAR
jgi:hypothetical protein